MIDLDLDVVRHRATGATELLDEDEFVEHQHKYGYPTTSCGEPAPRPTACSRR